MAAFKVGQRVRIISAAERFAAIIGDEVTIIGLPGCWLTHPDQYQISAPASAPAKYQRSAWYSAGYRLAPLADPSADRFIEAIKKLAREPINARKVEAA